MVYLKKFGDLFDFLLSFRRHLEFAGMATWPALKIWQLCVFRLHFQAPYHLYTWNLGAKLNFRPYWRLAIIVFFVGRHPTPIFWTKFSHIHRNQAPLQTSSSCFMHMRSGDIWSRDTIPPITLRETASKGTGRKLPLVVEVEVTSRAPVPTMQLAQEVLQLSLKNKIDLHLLWKNVRIYVSSAIIL